MADPPKRPGGGARGSDEGGKDSFDWLYGDRAERERNLQASDQRDDDQTQTIPQRPDSGPTEQGPSSPQQGAAQDPLPPMNLPPPSGRKGGRDARQSPRRPAGRPRRKRRWGRIVLVLVLLWLLFLLAVPIWAWNQIETVDATPDGDRLEDQPGTTYLVVGSDSRDDLDEEERQDLSTGAAGGDRTDTILLLHVGDGPPLLMSIPRDSPVEVPGRGAAKINSAFGGEGGGPELLVDTVEQNTGIRVDHYIEVGFGGFVDIVDGLGGIEVCPDAAIEDPKAGLDIDEGCQEVDGAEALGYARTRDFALADLTRVQNQREVIGAIGSKVASPMTVLNPVRYLRTIGAGTSSLRIGEGVGPIDLARFGLNMSKVTGGDGLSCTVPNTTTTSTLSLDQERAEQLFTLISEDRTDEVDESLCTETGQPG
ncbi:MAG: LCP family protein [Actinomycetota bacterium]|nr:LCP family protein [Actinomycetota bacterium]